MTLRELKDSIGPNPSPRTRQKFNTLALEMGQNNDIVQLEGGGLIDKLAEHTKKAGEHLKATAQEAGAKINQHIQETARSAVASTVEKAKSIGNQIGQSIADKASEAGQKAVESAHDAVQKAVKTITTPKNQAEEKEAGGGCVLM